MHSEISWLSVGQVGTYRIDIPIYTIGKGKPIFGITCSVHGDESSGLFIVSRLIEYLKRINNIRGTIHIILAANPLAQMVNNRVSPLDSKDLNRTGKGRQDGSFTDRIGAQLFDFLSQCDFVTNIHEFEMHTPVTAVFMNSGNKDIKTKTLTAIKAFSPDIIWVINSEQVSDNQYQTTLDAALANAGIANFPIETKQLAFLSDADIDQAALGLYHVASNLGMYKSSIAFPTSTAPAYFRQEVTSDEAGLWEPNCKLGQIVDEGKQIGTLKSLVGFKQEQVISPKDGILVQFRHRQLIATGTSLFSLGHSASHMIAPYSKG